MTARKAAIGHAGFGATEQERRQHEQAGIKIQRRDDAVDRWNIEETGASG